MLDIEAPAAFIVVFAGTVTPALTFASVDDDVVVGAPVVFRLFTPAFALPVLVPDIVVLELVPVVGLVPVVDSVVVGGVIAGVGTGVGITTGFAGGFVGGAVVGLVVGSGAGIVVGLVVGFVVGFAGVGIVVESLFVESVVGVGVGVGGLVGVCARITAGRNARPATPRILSLIGSP